MLLVWIVLIWILIFVAAWAYDDTQKRQKHKADEDKRNGAVLNNNEKTENSNDDK